MDEDTNHRPSDHMFHALTATKQANTPGDAAGHL